MRSPNAWLFWLAKLLLSAGILLSSSTALRAAQTVFYQPLNRDISLSAEQWRGIWQQTRAQGYDRVIVQWSAFGDERFDQNNWLLESLIEAHRQGLSLVIGLAADPAYFQTVLQPGWKESLGDYWASLLRQSLAQQQRLQPLFEQKQLPVEGWYLPAELSDRLFAERKRRLQTRDQLVLLAERLNRPLHVSAYSNGQLSPQANAAWLSSLEQAGLQVWWQDGEGIYELPPPARQAYLQALPCAIGVVREAFRQVSAPGAPFAAVSAPPQPPVPCHPDAVFELRYLPWAGPLLTPR
jgi:hypothetical protein